MISDLVITSLETLSAFDITTGGYLFTIDELQDATISQSQETNEITGKGGRRLATLKRNKTCTISGTNGMVSCGLLELQTGSKFENKATEVLWTDYLTVDENGEATTTYRAIGTAGAEIEGLRLKDASGMIAEELEQDAAAGEGKFAYDPETKKLTFDSGVARGTEVVALYKRNIVANVLNNQSDVFSGKCAIYVDAMAEDKCANVYRVQFYFPKADFNGEFNFEMGDNQTVHAFEAEALSGACGAAGTFWTYTVYGSNSEDASASTLTKIEVTTAPTKTSYTAGESFAPAGMVVTATYADGTEATLNAGAYTYTPNGALTTADTAVVVRYTENGVTKTASTPITVS